MKINEIPKSTQGLELTGRVLSAESKPAANKKMFMDIVLGDTTGSIKCKLWDRSEADVKNFSVGRVVVVKGYSQVYRDQDQFVIDHGYPLVEGQYDLNDFIIKAPLPTQHMKDKILSYLLSVENPIMLQVTKAIWDEAEPMIESFPAAKGMHHNYYDGLLFHMSNMLDIGSALCNIRPNLHRPSIICGIILHDLGKMFELEQVDGVVSDYTKKGKLNGHIVIIYDIFSKAVASLGIDPTCEEVDMIEHLILSHHGKLEWGSPVRPRTLDAVALHHIDNIDAKLQMVEDAYKMVEPGGWTEWVKAEETTFYKPKFNN